MINNLVRMLLYIYIFVIGGHGHGRENKEEEEEEAKEDSWYVISIVFVLKPSNSIMGFTILLQ